MDEKEGILNNLKAFNRKERYFLVGTALGNPHFKLCHEFRINIEILFGLDVPEDAFSAMDYHLDWVYTSLVLSQNNTIKLHQNDKKLIHATLEDIDFLVAFNIDYTCHIIFLEAKGVTLFSNRQLQSKITRLSDIFGKEGNKWDGIVPHFAIVSPKQPQRIKHVTWPTWTFPDGQVKWLKMNIAPGLKKVVRCNNEGKADNKGNYWSVRPGEY